MGFLAGGGEESQTIPVAPLRVPVAVLGDNGCQNGIVGRRKYRFNPMMPKKCQIMQRKENSASRVPWRARKRREAGQMVSRDRRDGLRGPGTEALNAQCQQVPLATVSSMEKLNSS